MKDVKITIRETEGGYVAESARGDEVFRTVTVASIDTAFKAAENMLGEILYWETY